MKKSLMVLVALFVCVALSAQAETLTTGKYAGTTTSIVPEINGQTATADVKTEGTKTVANITYPDNTKEVWTWDGTKLVQQELDATGKVVASYTANNVNEIGRASCRERV